MSAGDAAGEPFDALIVGGGPAGLTAAIYLGRFHRRVLLADARDSRARWIPTSRNLPGFPEGMHGETLLERMRSQAAQYDATVLQAAVSDLALEPDGLFRATVGQETIQARRVLLATGVDEVIPPVEGLAEAIFRGLVRVCPICDGYETAGKRVGVLGANDHAAAEALFLRTFAQDVTLVLAPGATLAEERIRALADAGVAVIHAGLGSVAVGEDDVAAVCAEDGRPHDFDTVYSAFGVRPRNALALALGAAHDDQGRLVVGNHQETSVAGLYAAGDLVRGLNQISVAEGEAAIAATAIHNSLPRALMGAPPNP